MQQAGKQREGGTLAHFSETLACVSRKDEHANSHASHKMCQSLLILQLPNALHTAISPYLRRTIQNFLTNFPSQATETPVPGPPQLLIIDQLDLGALKVPGRDTSVVQDVQFTVRPVLGLGYQEERK